MATPYVAYCALCGVATHGVDAFDVIKTQHWRFNVERDRHDRIVGKSWHCKTCKCKNGQRSGLALKPVIPRQP